MNLPNFVAAVDFCPTLCTADIVLSMAMSWGGTLEGVQLGDPDGFQVQRLRGIA
jgi:hypothetical protein